MAVRKVESKATTANETYTRRDLESLKEEHARTRTKLCPNKENLGTTMESPKDMIIFRENSLLDNSTSASNLLEKVSHLEVVVLARKPEEKSK